MRRIHEKEKEKEYDCWYCQVVLFHFLLLEIGHDCDFTNVYIVYTPFMAIFRSYIILIMKSVVK